MFVIQLVELEGVSEGVEFLLDGGDGSKKEECGSARYS
jgi:hypothetical protein